MESSAVLQVEAGEVEIKEGAAAVVRAETVRLEECQVGLVSGQEVTLVESTAYAVVGGVVRVESGRPIVVIGQHLDGSIQPMLDLRGAAVLGLLAGVGAALVFLIRGLFRRRR